MNEKEKYDNLKAHIHGKRKGKADLAIKLVLDDGANEMTIEEPRTLPDYSILESEHFFDSPYIAYKIFVEDQLTKKGYIREPVSKIEPIRERQSASPFPDLNFIVDFQKQMTTHMNDMVQTQMKANSDSIRNEMNQKEEFHKQDREREKSFFDDRLEQMKMFMQKERELETEKLRIQYDKGNSESGFSKLLGAIGEKLSEVPLSDLIETGAQIYQEFKSDSAKAVN